jgi:hypothetical protein
MQPLPLAVYYFIEVFTTSPSHATFFFVKRKSVIFNNFVIYRYNTSMKPSTSGFTFVQLHCVPQSAAKLMQHTVN